MRFDEAEDSLVESPCSASEEDSLRVILLLSFEIKEAKRGGIIGSNDLPSS
jgi:hypothetical protein